MSITDERAKCSEVDVMSIEDKYCMCWFEYTCIQIVYFMNVDIILTVYGISDVPYLT